MDLVRLYGAELGSVEAALIAGSRLRARMSPSVRSAEVPSGWMSTSR